MGTASGSPAAGPGSRAPGAAAQPDQHVVAAVAVEVAERHERRGGGPAGAGDLGAQRARTGAALDGEGAGGVQGEEAAGFDSHQVPDQLAAPDVTVEAMFDSADAGTPVGTRWTRCSRSAWATPPEQAHEGVSKTMNPHVIRG
ncbi:hypothetical protein AB0D65_03045 [Streptomyces griseoloalbus]|uniref:Uncharacterized protein n=1 Tax=Streptomyces griseoloalbus TaxID=67303 RepID=A0ABV3DYN0_9ACTN